MPLKGWKFLSSFILLKSWENSLKEKLFVTVFHLIENITTYICHFQHIYICVHTYIYIYIHIYIHMHVCAYVCIFFPNGQSLHCIIYAFLRVC